MTDAVTIGYMSSPSVRLFETRMNAMGVELVLSALPDDAVRARLIQSVTTTENGGTVGWEMGDKIPVPIADFVKTMEQSASSGASVADRVAKALGRSDYSDLVSEEPAATVFAALDKVGAKRLGELIDAIYGDASADLVTRVISKAGLDTKNEQDAAVAIAFACIVTEDAGKHPNPMHKLSRSESDDLMKEVHELKKSLNSTVSSHNTKPHYIVPLWRRPAIHQVYHPVCPR